MDFPFTQLIHQIKLQKNPPPKRHRRRSDNSPNEKGTGVNEQQTHVGTAAPISATFFARRQYKSWIASTIVCTAKRSRTKLRPAPPNFRRSGKSSANSSTRAAMPSKSPASTRKPV